MAELPTFTKVDGRFAGFRCKVCGKPTRLARKYLIIDTLHKEYLCEEGHETEVRRYRGVIEFHVPNKKVKRISIRDGQNKATA